MREYTIDDCGRALSEVRWWCLYLLTNGQGAIDVLYQNSSQITQIVSELRLHCPRFLTGIESLF